MLNNASVKTKMVVILVLISAVPVFDAAKRPIGMVQRAYDLSILEDFVKAEADDHTEVVIIDREGKILAHSKRKIEKEEDRLCVHQGSAGR